MDDSSMRIGLLLMRLARGLMLETHSLDKASGPGGIAGTARWFEALGLRPGYVHAWVTEIGAGGLMCVGLLFPGVCAAFVGLTTVAALTDHNGKGFFAFRGGREYVAIGAAFAGALAFVGPGRWSVDELSGVELPGVVWGIASVLVLVSAGWGTVLAFGRPTAIGQAA
jgi:putative oxidoreductase